MSFLPALIGGLFGLGGSLLSNSQNQQNQQQAQQTAAANQRAAINQANQLQQQDLQQALARFASYVQQNPNPLFGESILQAPNQNPAGLTFGGGTIGQPGAAGTAGMNLGAQAAAQGISSPQSLSALLQMMRAGQPSPMPNMPTAATSPVASAPTGPTASGSTGGGTTGAATPNPAPGTAPAPATRGTAAPAQTMTGAPISAPTGGPASFGGAPPTSGITTMQPRGATNLTGATNPQLIAALLAARQTQPAARMSQGLM